MDDNQIEIDGEFFENPYPQFRLMNITHKIGISAQKKAIKSMVGIYGYDRTLMSPVSNTCTVNTFSLKGELLKTETPQEYYNRIIEAMQKATRCYPYPYPYEL